MNDVTMSSDGLTSVAFLIGGIGLLNWMAGDNSFFGTPMRLRQGTFWVVSRWLGISIWLMNLYGQIDSGWVALAGSSFLLLGSARKVVKPEDRFNTNVNSQSNGQGGFVEGQRRDHEEPISKINKTQIMVCSIVAMIGSAYAPPPDFISAMLAGLSAGIVCLVLLFFIMSRHAIKEAKNSVKSLIAWQTTICIIAISHAFWYHDALKPRTTDSNEIDVRALE